MGSVYEARDEDLNRTVALKILSADLADDPGFRSRFLREARTLAALDSPHVIQVYEQGAHEGRLYIATQLVKGADLHQTLTQSGPLPAFQALDLVAQIAEGLADAHAAGLLHRDVKPSNVLVRTAHDTSFAYLCDFGIAVATGTEHTRTVGIIGTVDYMAPELHEGHDASVASDVYSLGGVLVATLTGRPPYAGTSPLRVAMNHLNAPIPVYADPSPAQHRINQILQRSLAKDPADRYATADEVRTALTDAAAVSGEPARELFEAQTVRDSRRVDTRETEATEVRRHNADPVAPGPPRPVVRRSSGHPRRLALLTAGVTVACIVAGTAYALASREATPAVAGSDPSGRSPSAPTASPTQSASSTPTAEAKPRPSRTATHTASMRCWDGGNTTSAAACGLPTGRAGLTTVFPSLAGDSTCVEIDPLVVGKAEVYQCDHGDFVIRYTRWTAHYARYKFYDTFTGSSASKWYVGSEFAGRQWWWTDNHTSPNERFQWIVSYRYAPYSLSVQGATKAGRHAGKFFVATAAPSHIGLA